MLYQETRELSSDLFQNPTREYRCAPFWAWNGKLNKEVLTEQLLVFLKMGMGGFHIHSRIGLDIPYLGTEFMEYVKYCNSCANENRMLTWLYDEDKWPSGYGGGRVTENKAFCNRYLLFSPNLYEDGSHKRGLIPSSRLTEDGELSLLAEYKVTLKNGRLESYSRLRPDTERSNGELWYAYLIITDPLPWFNNQAYVDTLNPKAIERFADVAYTPYYESLGEEFSKSVPAIFTDEPQFTRMECMKSGSIPQDVGIPYTNDLEDTFVKTYGYSLLDHLPEIFWDSADLNISAVRYRYHDHLAERFSSAYAGTLGNWCIEHNIMLTGHLMSEASLDSQSRSVGEAMRAYKSFQLPGIDILANRYEYTTAKQAQSAARQFGCPGVISELYGVTNWDFDFRGHKLQGDWQAALGVTVRVPHLAWMYMGGESKRDYPAPIDGHSPWHDRYPLIENHFARVNTAMTRGRAQVRIGVLHPIESYWLFMGPNDQTVGMRSHLENNFENITEWLLFNLLDFDYLAESLLPQQFGGVDDCMLNIGKMRYEVVVVPDLFTLRRTTLDILTKFSDQGGTVIFMGNVPNYIDALPNSGAVELSKNCITMGFEKWSLLKELENYRDVEIFTSDGRRTDRLIYQLRKEATCQWLFIAQGKPFVNKESGNFLRDVHNEKIEIRLTGQFIVELYNTVNGEITPLKSDDANGVTCIKHDCDMHDSLLFKLVETREPSANFQEKDEPENSTALQYLPSQTKYELAEPNILLLDMAKYRIDRGDWQESEEILRIDDKVRRKFNYSLRTDSFPQPWLTPTEKRTEHTVDFLFEIDSQTELEEVHLAFEGEENVSVVWNGAQITSPREKHFIDHAIHLIKLGRLNSGTNTLEFQVPFGVNTNLEWCYMLGDFGVYTSGNTAVVTKKPSYVSFGNYAAQGFSFYGGNFTYITEIETAAGDAEIEIPYYKAALLEVYLDEKLVGPVFAAPYRLKLGKVSAGKHTIKLLSFGTRINMFGQLHNCNKTETYFGPKTWRTKGSSWSYEYQLHEVGVLTAPLIHITA